jgi:hypothetical protein
MALHGYRPSPATIARVAECRPTAIVSLSVRVRFRIEGLISPNIADGSRALVSETGESQSFAHVQNFGTVVLVPKHWVPGCISRRTVSRCQWLKQLLAQHTMLQQGGKHEPQVGYPSQNAVYHLDCAVPGGRGLGSGEYSANQLL